MQPDHVACLAAYRELMALTRKTGLDIEDLNAVERIGTLHASALYERWCLVKILGILIETYGFRPPAGWQDLLVAAVTGPPRPSRWACYALTSISAHFLKSSRNCRTAAAPTSACVSGILRQIPNGPPSRA